MGDFAKWDDYLTTVWDHGYNYIHFTPLQKIGKSKSPYSISDQLELESSQFEEINTFLESWKRKLGFVTDVVWNHTANDSKWLKEREIQKFKNKNNCPTFKTISSFEEIVLKVGGKIKVKNW